MVSWILPLVALHSSRPRPARQVFQSVFGLEPLISALIDRLNGMIWSLPKKVSGWEFFPSLEYNYLPVLLMDLILYRRFA
jgi:hypothetical protein